MAEVCPRGCFALRPGSASPTPSPPAAPPCVCPESPVDVLGQVALGKGAAPPIPPWHCRTRVCLFGGEGPTSDPASLGGDGLEELLCGGGSSGHVPPWSSGTLTVLTWAREAPALLNPPLLPISVGLHGQLLQPDGLPVPPEAVWEAARRGRQACLQLSTLRQKVQIQGRPRLPCAVRTHGLGELPGRLRSPRSGAIPPGG